MDTTCGVKRGAPEASTPESVTAKKAKDGDASKAGVRDLSEMVHAELEVLQGIIDSDATAKRITVAQRKELTGTYRRVASCVREVSYAQLREQVAKMTVVDNTHASADRGADSGRRP